MTKHLAVITLAALACSATIAQTTNVFTRRILPILRSPNASSCAECHLSGVDLKQYIRPTERETFVALYKMGMIDANTPDRSHILELIQKSRPKTALVQAAARKAEFDAFRSWIIEVVADKKLLGAASAGSTAPIGPKAPLQVVRHTRIDHLVESFQRNIWSQQGRCMNCHSPGTSEFAANLKQHGDKVNWFLPNEPEATMRRIIERKLVNIDKPEDSVLLLKPLNKIPHGGGVKFIYGDIGYKQFRAWIDDYAASVTGKYTTVEQLPKPEPLAYIDTDAILTVTQTPVDWGDKLLRVDAFAIDNVTNRWSTRPIATGDRQVDAKGRTTNIWMWLIPPHSSPEEIAARRKPFIPAGRYLLKYYVDRVGRLNQNYKLPTDSPSLLVGSQEIRTDWKKGWGERTQVAVVLKN